MPEEINSLNIEIGISSCLLGEKVRFDTGHKHNSYITGTLGQFFTFRAYCPEMAIGLGTPRETLRLVEDVAGVEGTRCIGNKTKDLDVTQALYDAAKDQSDWIEQLSGYIFKKDSPSCGVYKVRVYKKDMPERKGTGIYAKYIVDNYPDLPVEEEGRLGDPVLREKFIKQVFAYHHWRQETQKGMSLHELMMFHSQYKYILMSHSQDRAKKLGAYVANGADLPLDEVKQDYWSEFMDILRISPSRKGHVNVLQHLQGFLKQDLDKDDKKELTETIEQYRLRLLPLIVPVVLLKHHFRKHPKPFVEQCRYLDPHPSELTLLNSL